MRLRSILSETPDEVIGPDYNLKWYDSDSITFTLIDDYYIYDRTESNTKSKPTHNHFAILLVYYCDPEKYRQALLDCNMDKITNNTVTNIDSKFCESDIAKYLVKKNYVDRDKLLEIFPDRVIQGRIWHKRKVVSCWDHPKYLKEQRIKIVKFINNIVGDPKAFLYEVEGQLISYNDFVNGNFETDIDTKYDNEVIHLLPPEVKRNELLKMGARPKLKSYGYTTVGD